MLQLRLTKKIAKDLKIITLDEPIEQDNPFNDWFINVFTVNRKKVAIFTHGSTMLSFFSLYSEIGGAKNLFIALKLHLTKYLQQLGFYHLQAQVESIFDGAYKFCKTGDKQVLGHMNDFIHGVKCYTELPNITGEFLSWEEITKRINETPMNNTNFMNPADLFLNYCCKLKH